ncbi:hypothetical protein HaLaN_22419 [Haematococcus lacustris]|uniref:Uncharacterized protein n=1 Tax=Haematococcus lacustris TaxID=44745 RepID=A0A699ZP44_HAELA|nr:hypothetical protein HaLaN_22419 [Haematococcus lacustris]
MSLTLAPPKGKPPKSTSKGHFQLDQRPAAGDSRQATHIANEQVTLPAMQAADRHTGVSFGVFIVRHGNDADGQQVCRNRGDLTTCVLSICARHIIMWVCMVPSGQGGLAPGKSATGMGFVVIKDAECGMGRAVCMGELSVVGVGVGGMGRSILAC